MYLFTFKTDSAKNDVINVQLQVKCKENTKQY